MGHILFLEGGFVTGMDKGQKCFLFPHVFCYPIVLKLHICIRLHSLRDNDIHACPTIGAFSYCNLLLVAIALLSMDMMTTIGHSCNNGAS